MIDIATEETIYRWSRQKQHVLASIISASQTWLALHARNVWLNGYPVSYLKVLNGRVYGQDDPSRFMS